MNKHCWLNSGFLLLIFVFSPLWAQAPSPQQPPPAAPAAERIKSVEDVKESLLTPEIIKSQIEQVQGDASLTEEVKKNCIDFYQKALDQLALSKSSATKAQEFVEAIQRAPGMLKSLRESSIQTESEAKIQILMKEASLNQINQIIAEEEAKLEAFQKELAQLQEESRFRTERRSEVPKLITAARQKLDEVNLQLNIKDSSDISTETAIAKRFFLLAQKKALQEEINAYEKEIQSYDNRVELLAARRDRVAKQISHTQEQIKRWREILNKRRAEEAEKVAKQAREEKVAATKLHPVARELVAENAQLAGLRTGKEGLPAKISATTQEVEKVRARLQQLQEEFKSVQEKAKAVGMTNVIGLLLRKKKAELPEVADYQKEIAKRQELIPQIQLKIIELEEERLALANIEQQVSQKLEQIEESLGEEELSKIETHLREQLETKKQYLDAVIQDYNTYFMSLVELNQYSQQFVQEVDQYHSYIDERILWVRSTTSLSLDHLTKAGEALAWLFSFGNWSSLFDTLYQDATQNPVIFFFGIVILFLLFFSKKLLQRRMVQIRETLKGVNTERFIHTWNTLLITLILAARLPAISWFLSWRLRQTGGENEFVQSFAAALGVVAFFAYIIAFFRTICAEAGLAKSHFKWKEAVVDTLARNLLFFREPFLISVFVVVVMGRQSNQLWRDSLGRAAFIISLFLLSIFFFRTCWKLRDFILDEKKESRRWLLKIWAFSTNAIVILPILFAILASIGYSYTAFKLAAKVWQTLLLSFCILLIYSLLVRWLYCFRRSLTLQLRKMKLVRKKQEEQQQVQPGAPEQEEQREEEIQQNLHRIRHRFLAMLALLTLAVGFGIIWKDVLPAFNIFRQIELWSTTVQQTQEIINPDGSVSISEVNRKMPVTLSDLLFMVILLVVTLIASRDIPNLLEAVILPRTQLDKGSRFALVAITRYLLLLVGFLIAFDAIGLEWSKLQWLAAGFTVGLGFGLQEIFANLVSGLIILFERPMRVGDIVTIGDTSGTVSRIQIRATTITDWDRKELIVPNKEFVTGRLINWTLSDTVIRIVIKVGISYSSNVAQAQDLLLQVAKKHPNVLSDPPPRAIFLSFGDNALNFDLRVFIPGLEVFLTVINDLNVAITQEFRNAKIEIAFPQRDLHLRSLPEEFTNFLKRGEEGKEDFSQK